MTVPNYRLREGSVQAGFNKSRAKVQIFGGAFANGKSTGLIIKALELARAYPGSLGLMARATYPKLNGTLRRDFMKWCPPTWVARKPTQDDNTCILTNKTEVQFRYVAQKGKTQEDGTTTSNLLSATYDWIVVDQIEDPEIVYKDFLDLLGRLRGNTPYRPPGPEDPTMPSSGPRWFMIGVNPTRNWFYREVVSPILLYKEKQIKTEKLLVDEETGEPIVELYESDTYANKENLEGDYIKTLETAYKGQMRERYLLGKWAAFEGLVHPAFESNTHTITREQAMAHLDDCRKRHVEVKVLEGYDFGLVSPSCYMLSFIDDYGRVIVIDGFHQPEFNYQDQPDAIREIRARYAGRLISRDPIIADPAIWRKTVVAKRETGVTVARLLTDLGLRLRPGQNDISAGIAKVNAYLADKLRVPHIVTCEMPSPMLYVVDDLMWFSDEITNYYWKKNTIGQHIDEPQDSNDHAMNTLKYQLSFLPEPSKIVIPAEQLPPKWMQWHEVSEEQYRSQYKSL